MLDGSPAVLRDVAMATNFGTQFAIIGFMGYKFACMIVSDTLSDSRDGFSGSSYPMQITKGSFGFVRIFLPCTALLSCYIALC